MMTSLAFQPCAICIHGLEDCCRCATIANSRVPKLAVRAGNAEGPNTECRIFLRKSQIATESEWQQCILRRLFDENEIAAAITNAFTEYANEWTEHHEGFAAEVQEVQNGGILPYFVLREIVIDEIEQEVILSLTTSAVEPLQDEGVAVCLRQGRWEFNVRQYLDDYLHRVQSRELGVRIENSEMLKSNFEIDPPQLFGIWEVDSVGTAQLLRESGLASEEIAFHLDAVKEFTCLIDHGKVIWNLPNNTIEFECVQQEMTGDQIVFLLRFQNHPEIKSSVLRWQGDLLIDSEQKVALKRRS